MSGEFEAAGSLAEGSFYARALEPRHGEATEEVHGACLNCGTELTGPYCHQCGQSGHVHRSLSAFGHDIAHGVLHFEGKFWRTLPMLAWKPGQLTYRYIHGERAKFISPMALFLFTVFLMFATFSYVGSPSFSPETKGEAEVTGDDGEAAIVKSGDWRAPMRAELAEVNQDIKDLETALKADDLSRTDRAALQKSLEDKQGEANGLAYALGTTMPFPSLQEEGKSALGGEVNTGWEAFDKWATKKLHKANKNPDLLLYKLQSNGYKFAWLLIPISIPFVWLVTIGKWNHRFYDHAVFTTYSISFMSLLFIVCALSVKFGFLEGWIITAAVFYAPFHMYRQLRHAYGLSRLGTVIRLFFLVNFVSLALILFFVALIALGLAG